MNILTAKPKRTAGNAWLERVNPLHGLTIAQARNIFDVARAHGSPLLQKIYDEIELVDPVLGVCVDRRQAALAQLGWKISPRSSADQVLADEQKDALDAFVRAIGNFTETLEHLDLAFFRGFSVVQPIWDGDAVRNVSLLESWNFLFDDDKRLLWNPDCSLDPRACFEIPAAARIVQVRRRRPIDYPALAIHIRKYLGERDWGRFIERYGIPPVDVVMAPNATNNEKGDYLEAAEAARDGRSTVWPSGTPQPTRAEGSRGQDPFSAFIDHQEKLIVLRATGGTLTSLAQADTGSLAGGAQMQVWDQIVQRDSSLISDALNRQLFWRFLERKFPGYAPAVEFSIGREREVTANDAADLAVKLRNAGYIVDQAELEEATGFSLEKTPQAPLDAPQLALNKPQPPATPFKTAPGAFKTPSSDPDGQVDPKTDDALVEALSGLFEKSLAEAAAEAVAGERGTGDGEREDGASRPSQEVIANSREYKREQNGQFSEVDHPSDFKPGDNPDSAEAQAAEIGKGKKAIERCLKTKCDIPNAVSRGDIGLISLRYGDEKSGLAHFKDRTDTMSNLADTLVRGKAGNPYQQGQKLNITHGGYVATLALTNSPEHSGYPKNWVLTSFGPKNKAKGAAV